MPPDQRGDSAAFNTDGPDEAESTLTCALNSIVALVHDRTPVIIRPEDYEAWMYGGRREALNIANQPYPRQMMLMTEVGAAEGNVWKDYPALLQTV